MSKLCLGTYLKAIKLCAIKNGFTQKTVFRDMFASIDCKYEPDEALIGHLVRGDKNPSPHFVSTICDMNPDKYPELADCMDVVVDKIDPNKTVLFAKILKKILDEDDSIADDTIVDLVNGTTKNEFPGKYDSLSSLLAGVFIYVIKNTDNKNQTNYVKEIDNDFIAEVKAKETIKADVLTSESVTSDSSESEELRVRKFLIQHEDIKEMIPLCQIAYAYDPNHNYVRTMYTEYNLFSEKARKYILDQCDASFMIDIKTLNWEAGLSLLRDDVEAYDLAAPDLTYMLGQYFPKFRYYPSHVIANYDENSFKRIFTSKLISVFPGSEYCDLDKYIDDYLWTKENLENSNNIKPMDYLCDSKLLRICPEEDVVFWISRFIIDACNNLSPRIVGKSIWADCFDKNAETIEDLSLSAMFALHKHYQFHNNIFEEYVIRL